MPLHYFKIKANRLQSIKNLHWKLIEASSALGGRLLNDSVHNDIDLGGAWIWDSQPRVNSLVTGLQIETFRQPDEQSSIRLVGGAAAMIQKLALPIPKETIHLDSPVVSCSLHSSTNGEKPFVEVKTSNDKVFRARHVVFAAPPKLISKHVQFDPPLQPDKRRAMEASQTWMAGVTKVALVYPKRFWDYQYSNMGLPRNGPAFQMYDSSTKDSSINALTFFTLVPHNSPAYDDDKTLAQMVAQQLASVWKAFGQAKMADQSGSFASYHVQRWPKERFLSEDTKPKTINPHPHPVRHLSTTDWGGMLHFAGSEADRFSPGVMEGAVSSAERVLEELEPIFEQRQEASSSSEL